MFAKINLTIYTPDKSKEVTVEVDAILTVAQIVGELIQNEFIPADYNYGLLVEGDGRVLSSHSTLSSIQDKAVVRIVAFSENKMVNGKKINVTILHPTNGQDMEVELNDGLTVEDIIEELIACNFIDDSPEKVRYKLFIKNSQTEISGKQTLVSGGTIDGAVLRVVI